MSKGKIPVWKQAFYSSMCSDISKSASEHHGSVTFQTPFSAEKEGSHHDDSGGKEMHPEAHLDQEPTVVKWNNTRGPIPRL